VAATAQERKAERLLRGCDLAVTIATESLRGARAVAARTAAGSLVEANPSGEESVAPDQPGRP
jgi:hypothetical protein